MDLYLRRYVLVHGFLIGIGALVVAPFTVIFMYRIAVHTPQLYTIGFYTYCQGIGDWAWLLCASWLIVGVCFLYGMLKRRKRALQPLLPMLGIHLLLIIVMDTLTNYDLNGNWSHRFRHVSKLANTIYVILHVSFTTVLLGRLFDETSDWKEINNAVYGQTTLSVAAESLSRDSTI